MIVFMLYLALLFMLQFFTLGAIFATIMIFYDQLFKTISQQTDMEWFEDLYDK